MKANKRSYRYKKAIRPKVRRQRIKQLLYTGAVLIVSILLVTGMLKYVPYAFSKIKNAVFAKNTSEALAATLESGLGFEIKGPFDEVNAGVMQSIEEKLAKEADLNNAIELTLLKYPYIYDIEVAKKQKNKPQTLIISLKEPVLASKELCLDQNGDFFKCYKDKMPSVNIELLCSGAKCRAQMPKKLVELLKELINAAPQFPAEISAFNIDGKNNRVFVKLNEDSVINWGSGEYLSDKVYRLEEVYVQAAARKGLPLYIDMTYFADGKIIAKTLPDSYGGFNVKK